MRQELQNCSGTHGDVVNMQMRAICLLDDEGGKEDDSKGHKNFTMPKGAHYAN